MTDGPHEGHLARRGGRPPFDQCAVRLGQGLERGQQDRIRRRIPDDERATRGTGIGQGLGGQMECRAVEARSQPGLQTHVHAPDADTDAKAQRPQGLVEGHTEVEHGQE